jgi:glycosyltransferase involved in cell wall biosynthesis
MNFIQVNINGRFLTQSITGVQRYAIEIVKAIDKLIENGEINANQFSFRLIAPKNIKYSMKLKHIKFEKKGNLTGHLWEQLELPFYSRKGLLMNLCNVAPMFKMNQIVTIHDAAVFANPNTFSYIFRQWYKILLLRLGKTSRQIITDSFFSKSELKHYCKIDEDKIKVVGLGKDHVLSVSSDYAILKKMNIDKPYVLAVSSMSPNKNFESVVKAIEILGDIDFNIVIAGGVNRKIFNRISLPSSKNIKYVGYVSDGELRALYEQADCFIYPSFYEGFGLPPIEAMTCGCPVILSNTASMPEVCADAALYCDPYSPMDIAQKIKKLMTDETLKETLILKGTERANIFNWKKSALQIIDIINKQERIL